MSDDAPADTLTETAFGFDWGGVRVERLASHKGQRLLRLSTPRQHVDVRVTPSGLIRIADVTKSSA